MLWIRMFCGSEIEILVCCNVFIKCSYIIKVNLNSNIGFCWCCWVKVVIVFMLRDILLLSVYIGCWLKNVMFWMFVVWVENVFFFMIVGLLMISMGKCCLLINCCMIFISVLFWWVLVVLFRNILVGIWVVVFEDCNMWNILLLVIFFKVNCLNNWMVRNGNLVSDVVVEKWWNNWW